jgi:hypothetical protein
MPLVMRATKGWTSGPMPDKHVRWHVAMRPGLRRALDKDKPLDALIDQLERTKARIRAKVEHPFRVLKQQFGYVKVRYRGLKKNTAQIVTLFALSNLWMARHKLLAAWDRCACKGRRAPRIRGNCHRAGPPRALHARNCSTSVRFMSLLSQEYPPNFRIK